MITVTVQRLQKFSQLTSARALRHGLALLCLTAALCQPAVANPSAAQPTRTSTATEDPMAALKDRLARDYPDVQHISITTYLEQHPSATLIDVRAAQEYAVSRIPNAIHLADRAALLKYAQAHEDQILILYCSVGARSADAAKYLQGQPRVGQVYNLAGSIFEWSNSGRPLENDSGATEEVHPFNAWWGWRYLQKRNAPTRRDEPKAPARS